MKIAPKFRGGGEVPKIDRTKYKDKLINPKYEFQGQPGAFNPDVLGVNNYEIVSGSEKNGDLVARKGGNYYLYHQNGDTRGLVNIGDPLAPVSAPVQPSVPKKAPQITDPMTVSGYNGIITEPKMKKGGKVPGYAQAGVIVDPEVDNTTELPAQQAAPENKVGFGDVMNAVGQVGLNNIINNVGEQQTPDDGFVRQNRKANDVGMDAVQSASPALNLLIPGLGTATSVGVGLFHKGANAALNSSQKIDSATGQFKNKQSAEIVNAVFNPWNAAKSLINKDAKNGLNSIEQQNMAIAQQEKDDEEKAKMEALRSSSTGAQIAERGFSLGGTIMGKGTGTSDSIHAEVKPGSFVVPAKNEEIAELLRTKVLGKPPKRAKVNQSNGVSVKLSNGEHLFTPSEKEELESKGIDVEALAPDAKESSENEKNGGLTPGKARKMLHDGTANGHPITEKQRKYFGYVSGLKDGGMVDDEMMEKKMGMMDDEKMETKKGGEVGYADGGGIDDLVKELDSIKKEQERKDREYAAYKKRIGDAEDAAQNKHQKEFYSAELNRQKSSKQKEIEGYLNEYKNELANPVSGNKDRAQKAYIKAVAAMKDYKNSYGSPKSNEKSQVDVANMSSSFGENARQAMPKATAKTATENPVTTEPTASTTTGQATSSKSRKAPVVPKAAYETSPADSLIAKDYSTDPTANPDFIAPGIAQKTTPTGPVMQQVAQSDNQPGDQTTNQPSNGRSFDWASAANSALGYGLPIAQTLIGLKGLKNAGARPADSIDPDYLKSIDSARANLIKANNQAKYGYSPEEKYRIEQENQSLLNAGRNAARMYSGGSNAG